MSDRHPLKGHRLEPGVTVSLWRFNEEEEQSYEFAYEETGKTSFVLSQSLQADTPKIVGSPAQQSNKFARHFDGVSDNMAVPMANGSNASDMAAVLTGSHTVECWVRPTNLATEMTIISVGGVGENLASNYLLWWRVNSSGNQSSFWEYSTGINQTQTQSTGDTVTTDEWQHLAISHEVVGANRVVRWYRNGVMQDFGTGTNASGDLTVAGAELTIGEEQNDQADFFYGAMSDMRISNVVRSDAEISSSYNTPSYEHDNDDDTFLLWRFNEPAHVKDETGRYPLTIRDTTNEPEISFPLIRDGGMSRYFNADGADRYFQHPGHSDLAGVLSGSFTMEWWGVVGGTVTSNLGMFSYADAVGETEPTNILFHGYFDSSRRLNVAWEHSGGLNVTQGSAVASYSLAEKRQIFHMAIVKDVSEIDGTVEMRSYYNGELRDDSLTGLTNTTGGTDRTNNFRVGASITGFGSTYWYGYIDDMRLSNVAKTGDQINQSYLDGKDNPFRSYPITQRARP